MYRETFSQVYAYCLRRVGQRDDVDDVVSEVYASVWRRLDDAVDARSPIAWIFGIAYRSVGNQRRGRRRADALADRAIRQPGRAGPDPLEEVETRERLASVEEALLTLQPQDQELLRLALWDELTNDEVAEAMGIEPTTVRSRLYRARRRLQHELNDPSPRDKSTEVDTKGMKNERSGPLHRKRRKDNGRPEGMSP